MQVQYCDRWGNKSNDLGTVRYYSTMGTGWTMQANICVNCGKKLVEFCRSKLNVPENILEEEQNESNNRTKT